VVFCENNSQKDIMLTQRTLPLSALRSFASAAAHLHMGKAGDELGVTHGAVSHQIRNLEDILGIRLFSRAHKRLQLTSAGVQLFEAVTKGFSHIIEGTRNLSLDSIAGPLVVGCTQTSGASWVVKHIGAFQERYPEITIYFQEIKPGETEIPKNIDVAICYGQPEEKNRQVLKLASPLLYPVCSPKLLHRKQDISRPDHLAGMPLLHDRQNSWKTWFELNGSKCENIKTQMHFDSTYMCMEAARQGCGVALCNAFEIHEDLKDGVLMKLLNKSIPEAADYYLVTHMEHQQSIRASLFQEWIRTVVDAI